MQQLLSVLVLQDFPHHFISRRKVCNQFKPVFRKVKQINLDSKNKLQTSKGNPN